MDLDNIGAGPDIDNIDIDKMSFGNEFDGTTVTDEPAKEAVEPENAAVEGGETEGEVLESVEQARDDKGRFAEKDTRIPKARFDEAVNKEREARAAAEARATDLERKLNESSATQAQTAKADEIEAEIEKLEVKHAEFLLDGNTAEATKLMRQIRHMEREIASAEAEQRAVARTSQAIEADRFNVVVARVEADHPQFNPESDSYDPDLVELVLAKQRSLMESQGLSPSKAIEKAAKDVAERFLKVAEAKAEAKGLAAGAGDDRKKAAVQKAVETQGAQAPSTKEVGMDSDKFGEKGLPDVSKMTSEEFAALPKSTQDRLMGNLV